MPFPLTPVPSHYATITHSKRSGIYYEADTVAVTLSQATPTDYEIRDYFGTVVDFGSVSGASLSLGSFAKGWYRGYLTGPINDAVFGFSYGTFSFVVVEDDPRFVPNPSPSVGPPQGGGEAKDLVMKGVLGIGTQRHQIADASNPTTGVDTIAIAQFASGLSATYWSNPGAPYADRVRERLQMLQFPNRAFDRVPLTLVGLSSSYLRVYLWDTTLDGNQVFLKSVAGSTSGAKVEVYYPNTSTLVETYDNLASASAAATAVNAASARVRAASTTVDPGGAGAGPTAIGSTYRDGVIATVQALFAHPYRITRYEGPINEGQMDAELVYRMKVFAASVHAGHPDAKAIGPAPVDITNLPGWETFLAAGGGNECDEISFHAYNSITNGDINLGRATIEEFKALLAEYGQEDKVLWHTEATHVFTSVYGVYHPRRNRVPLLQTLLWEQYGVPNERNLVWYDRSHGFWDYPAYLIEADSSPVPATVMYRVLAEETFEKIFHHRLDFGSRATNAIFLGSVYSEPVDGDGTSTVILLSESYIPNSTVTLTLETLSEGASVTIVDAFGATSTEIVTSGRITVEVSDIPVYVRLPANVRAWVYSATLEGDDFGSIPKPSVSAGVISAVLGGVDSPIIADDAYMTNYGSSFGIAVSSTGVPDDAILQFGQDVSIEWVVIHCGPAWQTKAVLIDFDIDTWDGAVWTTRKTVTKATPTSFLHGASSSNSGTQRETYWDEQWVFPVKLTAPVTAQGVRVHARVISFGGEPDAAAVASGGQGDDPPNLSIEEIAVISPTTLTLPTGYATDVLSDSPNGYWRIGETSGAAVSQVNSPTLDGAYDSGMTRGVGGVTTDSDRAVRLVASDTKAIRVPDNALLDLGDTFSIEMWVRLTATPLSVHRLIEKGNQYELSVTTGRLVTLTKSGFGALCTSTVALQIDIWHHVVATKTGATIKLYLDGTDVTGTISNTTYSNNGTELTIGNGPSSGGGSPAADIDEVAVYPTVLSQARAQSHFSKAGPAPPIWLHTPGVEGSVYVGEQANCTVELTTWEGALPNKFTYQWQDSADGSTGWANIASATRADYIIPSSKIGKFLRCNVTAQNIAGSDPAASSEVVGPVLEIGASSPGKTRKRLYGPAQLGSVPGDLYIVPSGMRTVIRQIHVFNAAGSPVNFTLSIGTDAAATRLWDAFPVPSKGILHRYRKMTLTEGEAIQAFASTGGSIVLVINGYEEST